MVQDDLDVAMSGFEESFAEAAEWFGEFGRKLFAAIESQKMKERAERQRVKALKRNAKRADKSPFSPRLKDVSRKGRSSHTAKVLNSIGQAKALGWTPRPRLAYDASTRRKSPPRGRAAIDIPYLGHVTVKQNPALKHWEAK